MQLTPEKATYIEAKLKQFKLVDDPREQMLGLTADHCPVGNQSTYIRVANAGI